MIVTSLIRWITKHPDVRAWLITVAGSASYIAACSFVGKRRWLPQRLNRKLMHLGAGPLFALCWPLYSTAASAPLIAASVPLLAAVQFALVGSGRLPDFVGLVKGATRSGIHREELLQGPLLYGVVHGVLAATHFCQPSAILAVAALCFGDGLAEVVGRGFHSPALPWNGRKTMAGSAACFAGSVALGWMLLQHFSALGALRGSSATMPSLQGVAACALAGTLVESIPLGSLDSAGLDNITMPLAVLLSSRLFLP